MTPYEFGQYLDRVRPALKAYGKFVIGQIEGYLRANLSIEEFKTLIKVGPTFRVKDTASAIKKIVKKPYHDPLNQMTDVVGVRFVVLLQADLNWIEKAILNCNSWTARKDRAPLMEIADNPEVFEYKSTHFIIRLNDDLKIDDFHVARDTPCEIQIRTLVQHAYAEFVHDRVYKGDQVVSPKVRRLVARAMAMLESTDEIFSEASQELSSVTNDLDVWHEQAEAIYVACCGSAAQTIAGDSEIFYQTYRHLLSVASLREVRSVFESFAADVKEFSDGSNLFSQSYVVPIFWLLKNHDQELATRWCLGKYRSDLETAASLLGIGLGRSL